MSLENLHYGKITNINLSERHTFEVNLVAISQPNGPVKKSFISLVYADILPFSLACAMQIHSCIFYFALDSD